MASKILILHISTIILTIFISSINTKQFLKRTSNNTHSSSASSSFSLHETSSTNKLVCNTDQCHATASMLLKYMNFSVDPCDDFYEFSCGRWISENPIPSTAFSWSADDVLRLKVDKITQEILTSEPDPTDFKPLVQAKQLYAQCIDKASLEDQGLNPVLDILNSYGGWPAISSNWNAENFNISKVIADANRIYSSLLLQEKEKTHLFAKIEVGEDLRNTSNRMIVLDQPMFSLPPLVLLSQEDYEPRILAFKNLFISIAKAFLALTGSVVSESELSEQFDDIIAFEAKLANASTDEENRNDLNRLYNRMQLFEFENVSETIPASMNHSDIDWSYVCQEMFNGSGVTILDIDALLVYEPGYLQQLITILDTTPAITVANYAMWRFAYGLVPYTTDEMRSLIFEYRKVAYGIQQQPQWESECAINAAQLGFGMAIGVKYIEKAFDIEAKNDVDQMVDILKNSFIKLLDEAEWMEPSTQKAAKDKIEAVSTFVAYPEWLFNKTRIEIEYEGLELSNTYLKSAIAMSDWESLKKLKTLRQPTDKAAWHTYPGIVNAHYVQETNAIQFPAANFAPPYYLAKGPKFINFGGIGAIIGHELTHALDVAGSQYDKDGNFKNWWSPITHIKFEEKSQCFVQQYAAFNTSVGSLNGNLTSSENIADNGGFREALQGYRDWVKKSNKGKEEQRLPGLEKFTPEQLFFVGYGISWCANMTKEELLNQLYGYHSPPQFRVWGPIQNSVDFGKAFNCAVGAPMNPPAEKKCTLW